MKKARESAYEQHVPDCGIETYLLHLAVSHACLTHANALLQVDKTGLNTCTEDLSPVLHVAMGNGHACMAQYLIAEGAQVNVLDTSTGLDPLEWGMVSGMESFSGCVHALMDNTCDLHSVNGAYVLLLATARNDKEYTAQYDFGLGQLLARLEL